MEPKIRFKGFKGEWQTSRLDACVDFLDNLRKPIDEGSRIKGIYPYYGASGIVDYVHDYIFDEELILLSEDGANITDRNYPVCFLASGKYWVNNHAHVLKSKNGFVNNFVCNAMECKDYSQYNTGMAMPKLNKEVCKRIPLTYPSIDEQQTIAYYFQHLDTLIQSTAKKIESLKQVKAASLQSMFPQEGETTPRVRFKGFKGEWEKVLLGNTGFMTAGGTPSTFNPEFWDGSINWLQSGAIQNSVIYPAAVEKKITEKGLKQSSAYLIRKDSVLIAITGATCANIGFLTFPSAANQSVVSIETYDEFDAKFIYQNLLTERNQILSFKGGSAQSGVSLGSLKKVLIKIPKCIEEQKAIGEYLSSLDTQITLQTQRLEKLKQIKSACLDNMFV